MIDSVVKNAIEEALRFLQPGDQYRATVNEHDLLVTAIRGGVKVGGFLVACETCERLLAAKSLTARAGFIAIHNHAKHEEQGKDLVDAKA